MDFSLDVFEQLPRLAALAQGGQLYQAAAVLTASAVVNANVVLFNSLNNGLPLWLFRAVVQASAAMEVDLLRMDSDPALTIGTKPQNLYIGGRPAGATFEAQAVAAPANNGQFGAALATNSDQYDLLPSGILCIPRNEGIMLSSGLVAGNVLVTLMWAEIDPAFSDYLAERE